MTGWWWAGWQADEMVINFGFLNFIIDLKINAYSLLGKGIVNNVSTLLDVLVNA